MASPRHKQAINFATFLAIGSLADMAGYLCSNIADNSVMGDNTVNTSESVSTIKVEIRFRGMEEERESQRATPLGSPSEET